VQDETQTRFAGWQYIDGDRPGYHGGTALGYSILNRLPQFSLPELFSHGAILGIFIGAVLWLAGARISGREQVADRYWWLRNYDKRCRRGGHHHHG